ncbi:MAG TPA: CpsD/CapB family tyrosine-protein kinase [Candidatus Atribacteria bacterium]|nr:CpsD/CapB family tyrosine-protein kinase [Candidatus Atribacteria bacterium]
MANSSKLIANHSAKSVAAEAYKTLRTNIQYSSPDKSLKVILVTSFAQSEGKSTTAANLAITLAQSDKRVLLVDCDLRKPSLHRVFGIINAKGVTNVLVQNVDYHEISNMVEIENLEVLTSGPKPPNPSELLGSAKMESFISSVAAEYDMVILDAPPVLPVTDAVVLARLADGVIFVVNYGKTTHEMGVEAKARLEKVNAKILGVVINNTPIRRSGRYEYYYYYEDSDIRRQQARAQR